MNWPRRALALVLVVALPSSACARDSDPVNAGDGTTPAVVDDAAQLCTAEDEAAILERLEGNVLVWIDEGAAPELECGGAGTWEWEVDGLADAAALGDLRAEISSSLEGAGMTGHVEQNGPAGGWRTIWRGPCSATVDCLVDVEAGPGGTGSAVDVLVHAQHADHASDRELAGDEFAARGLAVITAAPVSGYCSDTVAAIHGIGAYRAPRSTLTTQTPGTSRLCNTVPLSFELVAPQRFVTVEFWGADSPYLLQAFDTEGRVVAESTAHGVAYEYDRTFTVSVDAGSPTITRFAFGEEKSGTHVVSVTFGQAAPAEQEVRFDGFRSAAE